MKKIFFSALALGLVLSSCKKPSVIHADVDKKNDLESQLRAFSPEPVIKTENANEVIVITTESGNKISFPKNAFVDQNGNPITGNVEVEITEITNISDMLLSGMLTNSDQGPLSSQGEFNIRVTQNGEELDLATGESFTIENPNATMDSTITGWDWIPNMIEDQSGNITEADGGGQWVQNGSTDNNLCDRLLNLELNLTQNNLSSSAGSYWNDLQAIQKFLHDEASKLVDLENKTVAISSNMGGANATSYNVWNGGDEWYYNNSGGNEVSGNGNTFTQAPVYYTGVDINVEISGCQISIDSSIVINLDPNSIVIPFMNLNWCNIDRLLGEYGQINNCVLKGEIPKNATVSCVFRDLNGATDCRWNGNEFIADRLPDGLDIEFFIYYQEGNKIKCGSQIITAAQEMMFDVNNFKTLDDVGDLVEEINKITEGN